MTSCIIPTATYEGLITLICLMSKLGCRENVHQPNPTNRAKRRTCILSPGQTQDSSCEEQLSFKRLFSTQPASPMAEEGSAHLRPTVPAEVVDGIEEPKKNWETAGDRAYAEVSVGLRHSLHQPHTSNGSGQGLLFLSLSLPSSPSP